LELELHFVAANDSISIDIKYSRSVAFRSQGNLGAADRGEYRQAAGVCFAKKTGRFSIYLFSALRGTLWTIGKPSFATRGEASEASRHQTSKSISRSFLAAQSVQRFPGSGKPLSVRQCR
jgi:hypothetical protein